MARITELLDKNLTINFFGRKLLNINIFIALLYKVDSAEFFLSGVGKQRSKTQQNCE